MQKKYLIVNADDYGFSKGITDGILEAHERGIVTSTSLMVSTRWARYAATRSKEYPRLSIGLHGQFFPGKKFKAGDYAQQLEQQLEKFRKLMGKEPSHFDLHGVPKATREMNFGVYLFLQKHPLHFRANDRLINEFYGLKNGFDTEEKITQSSLMRILEGLQPGISVLICHPGKSNRSFHDPYNSLRRREIITLTSPAILSTLEKSSIYLMNYYKEVVNYETKISQSH